MTNISFFSRLKFYYEVYLTRLKFYCEVYLKNLSVRIHLLIIIIYVFTFVVTFVIGTDGPFIGKIIGIFLGWLLIVFPLQIIVQFLWYVFFYKDPTKSRPVVHELTSKSESNVYKSTKISLELKSIQSREFSANKKVVFASVLSVFQDYGYSISAADMSTGLITAKSKTQFSRGRDKNSDSREFSSKYITYYIATAFVEDYTLEITKARLNFIIAVQIINANGTKSFQENTVEDSAFYNNAFVKIQEEIFLRININ